MLASYSARRSRDVLMSELKSQRIWFFGKSAAELKETYPLSSKDQNVFQRLYYSGEAYLPVAVSMNASVRVGQVELERGH